MLTEEEKLRYEYDNFLFAICPYGSLDVRTAINAVIALGKDGNFLAELIDDWCEETGSRREDVDVVGIVYDYALNEARNEIEELTGFDFCNDGAEVYVHWNYTGTQYDYRNDANEIIKRKLMDNDIKYEDLSIETQWFLDGINVQAWTSTKQDIVNSMCELYREVALKNESNSIFTSNEETVNSISEFCDANNINDYQYALEVWKENKLEVLSELVDIVVEPKQGEDGVAKIRITDIEEAEEVLIHYIETYLGRRVNHTFIEVKGDYSYYSLYYNIS